MGLEGVDNGSLWFDHVLVPRDMLLGRYASVDDIGAYHSPIASPGGRFFTMLATLVAGRVSVATAALSASKLALTVAIRHGHRRRQFGPSGGLESRVLDYPTHQRRLMPALAAAYAFDAALAYLVERYLARSDADAREIETLAAGLKAVVTWANTDTLQRCRECCGGRGYLAESRIGELMADSDVFTTFEGDNTVLMQLVAKGLLSNYKERFDAGHVRAIARIVASRTWVAAVEKNPVATRRTDPDHLRDPELHAAALRFREETLLAQVANQLQRRLRAKVDPFTAFTECQLELVALSSAHVDRIVCAASRRRLDAMPAGTQRDALTRLHDLHVLSCLERNAAWLLEHDYIADVKSRAISELCTSLCREVRDDALDLVAAFAIPDSCLPSWAAHHGR
jgi:acyl-CoA oxidase